MAKDDTIDVDDVYRRLRVEGQAWMENSPQRKLMNDARAAIRKLKKAARRAALSQDTTQEAER